MRRPGLLLIAPLTALAGSCSGGLDVTPCLLNDRLAFELGDVPRFFFVKERPTPHHISVQIPGPPYWEDEQAWQERLMWDTGFRSEPDGRITKRSMILYGQKIPGVTATQAPRQLQEGTTYRVYVAAGAFAGGMTFRYSRELDPCLRADS